MQPQSVQTESDDLQDKSNVVLTRQKRKVIKKNIINKQKETIITQKRFEMIKNTISYYVEFNDEEKKPQWVVMQQLKKYKQQMQKYDNFITALQDNKKETYDIIDNYMYFIKFDQDLFNKLTQEQNTNIIDEIFKSNQTENQNDENIITFEDKSARSQPTVTKALQFENLTSNVQEVNQFGSNIKVKNEEEILKMLDQRYQSPVAKIKGFFKDIVLSIDKKIRK